MLSPVATAAPTARARALHAASTAHASPLAVDVAVPEEVLAAVVALSDSAELCVSRPLADAASSPLVPSGVRSCSGARMAASVRTATAGEERVESAKGSSELATTQPVLLPNETRVAARAPRRLPNVVADAVNHEDADESESTEQSHEKSSVYDTEDPSVKSSECSVKTPDAVKERIREMRLGKRRRQRQQQKDELKHLALRVEELKAYLTSLRQHKSEFSEQTLVAAKKLNVFPADAVSVKEIWKQLSGFEREQLRTSLMENSRLRAQYECQLQIANGLKRLYESEDSFSVLQSPDRWFLAAKKPRNDTLSEDSLVFATLGRDFDAQYAQADSIMDSAGLSNYDGELEDEMLLRKNEHGGYYFDNLYSKVFPFSVETIDRVLGQCLTIERLQSFHNDYKVIKVTKGMVWTKAVNTFKIGNTETTLTIRVVTKKYKEEHRVVGIWQGHIETEGAVCMQLRETGWNIIRPAHTLRPGQHGPVSIEQACVRITPEVQPTTTYTDASFAVGTLANLLIEAYHKRMEQVHLVADDILAIQLESMSLGD